MIKTFFGSAFFAVALLLALVVQPKQAQQRVDFASVDAFLKQTLTRGNSLSADAKGELNGDGLEDWAETDMNLLTGVVIEKKWRGENKPTTTRRKRVFGRFLLKDFDFF